MRAVVLLVTALAACHAPMVKQTGVWRSQTLPGLSATGQTQDEREDVHGAVFEASFQSTSKTEQVDPAELEVRAVDPVIAELLQAVFHSYEQRRAVILENIANVGTTAYKRRKALAELRTLTAADGREFQLPVFSHTLRDFSMGTVTNTDRDLDVAIDGLGFFAVIMSDGSTGFTRNGALHINADGRLVTAERHIVLPEISVPNDTLEISIAPTGRVSVRTSGSPDGSTVVGRLMLHRFVNSGGLQVDGHYFRPTEASGSPITSRPGAAGVGALKQGFLEGSNVQQGNELIELQVLENQYRSIVNVMQHLGMVAPLPVR